MKLGIFADVHGNIYAFEKVWGALKKERCDQYIFLGDICGYYYYQNEIIEALKGIGNIIMIKGNHDAMFLQTLNDQELEEQYTQKYGLACRLLKASITSENLGFLKGLPDHQILREHQLAIFHGSPWDSLNEYIYPDASLERFEKLPYKWVLLGHTHHPMDRWAGSVRIINPGSCGQPRDYNVPSYAILDLKANTIQLERVPYNIEMLIKDIRAHGEKNPYLIDVLKRTERNEIKASV